MKLHTSSLFILNESAYYTLSFKIYFIRIEHFCFLKPSAFAITCCKCLLHHLAGLLQAICRDMNDSVAVSVALTAGYFWPKLVDTGFSSRSAHLVTDCRWEILNSTFSSLREVRFSCSTNLHYAHRHYGPCRRAENCRASYFRKYTARA